MDRNAFDRNYENLIGELTELRLFDYAVSALKCQAFLVGNINATSVKNLLLDFWNDKDNLNNVKYLDYYKQEIESIDEISESIYRAFSWAINSENSFAVSCIRDYFQKQRKNMKWYWLSNIKPIENHIKKK